MSGTKRVIPGISIRNVKKQLLNLAGIITQVVPLQNPAANSSKIKKPLVILPAGYGSFGDMAIAIAIDGMLPGQVEFLVPDDPTRWSKELQNNVISMRDYTYTIAMLPNPRKFGELANRDILVIGADTISGAYETSFLSARVRLLNEANKKGYRTQLTNFSFPSDPTKTSVELLKRLTAQTEFWARDKESKIRFRQIVGFDAEIAPDIAAAMKIPDKTENSAEATGVLVPNSHFESTLQLDSQKLLQKWAETAEAMSRHFPKVVITVNDIRPEVGDMRLANEIASQLSRSGIQAEVIEPVNAVHAKQIYNMADVLVTGRMHAGVAALSLGIPTYGIEYLGKFEGQFEWYEVPNLVQDASGWLECPLEEISTNIESLLAESHQRSSGRPNVTWGWIPR
ncbi:Polysaccharide pyruvyl transferase [Corynebacterium kalinowskii]|uniref:Polysaccharide pyruvyl transferase n=1 Tax=Corynebacterium kalinowskii TaxID=2675216 RepID=A0A6B8VD83_9CORY|nr:polysaccharide pyruvyl transferase family protein [Corynebacterium kalinowskii]QGU01009.1 Polysaccharide pyruvyl transferase [Corynebacterium kalinowskii]